ncbi:hypothetical protein EF914_11620 [Streptomyces sp. WAC05458]|nr:hypothetical protein [Streptomyces sp. KAI 90]PVD06289.1 hypothetical protein DBP22_25880 [Streptomyces sp. CS207]QCB23245.1 hypothetical protein E5N77_16565 [Streptomyces sp. SS52]RIH59849.1 hypothetical protein D3C59_22535 [Streptomyces sp. SHP22-7]RSS07494.1 hypothetical protein EF915_36655 [Streptomyces sp. WAC08401]RSS23378.1 hypothetical protein EF914_11620 [Streptomyces sp. WAC05458]RSS72395.1 hypothetical protein EF911_23355 [Streptomyces sp. WAC06128]
MPDDIFAVAGRCGMFVPGPRPRTITRGLAPGPGVPGPGCWLDRGHGRVRSRRRARHGEAIPN